MPKQRSVTKTVTIKTTAELAFEALTEARELREWMCDQAWTEPWAGGRYEVRWNSGYHAVGKFSAVEAPKRAVVSWRGTEEPGESSVEFAVAQAKEGVVVSIVHGGFGSGPEWDAVVTASERGWATGVDNLKSTLETGVDLRIAGRPFLGITYDILDPARAERENIAAERGIYVNDTVEGSGARAAGLGRGDVILSIGGIPTQSYFEIGSALNARQAGEIVEMEIVHGQERRTVSATLGTRPQEEVPSSLDELVQRLGELYAETDAELRAAVEELTEAEAERRPAEDEWSVEQVLAHLSIVERDVQNYVATIALDGWQDSGSSNPTAMPGRLAAALSVAPTVPELLGRYFADERESIALLRELPEETVMHKARLRRIAQSAAVLPEHTREHIEQIKTAIAAVRG